MEQAFGKYLMFKNRLSKVFRHLSRQAKKMNVSCYRIYDHDLPEFPFIIEIFEGRLSVSEYQRHHKMTDDEHALWLEQCVSVISEVLGVSQENIFLRLRHRKEGRMGQYRKVSEDSNEFIVSEGGLKFIVNLSDYLDTGLFLDHRITRQMIREQSNDKRVLNLFCYTGSFSVYAAAGGASQVTSVDLSKTYLQWTERNIEENFSEFGNQVSVHADAMKYLKELPPRSFDIIVMDPPTFSNSKRMDGILDIQRDHVELINDCLHALDENGTLYFSTNYTKFELHAEAIQSNDIRDITRQTTPFDFEGKLKRKCYRIVQDR